MAISDYTRLKLATAVGSHAAADAILDVIDADGGTLDADSTRRLQLVLGVTEGNALVTDIDADSTMADPLPGKLTQIIGGTAASEIDTEQGS